MRIGVGLAIVAAGCGAALAEPPLTIEKLLAEGWEIAGWVTPWTGGGQHKGGQTGTVG